jgi:Zn-dependent protease
MNGVPVARLFGIEIRLHLSWIFIIAIVTVTVGGRLGSLQPSADASLAWVIGAVAALGFLGTVVAHELAHALVSRRAGMPIEAITVHFIGSPATVDVRANTPRSEAAVALAGPLTSLFLGVVLIVLSFLGFASEISALRIVGDVLFIVGALDIVLAGVSIVPAFPLDGGRVVRAIVWARTGSEIRGARSAGRVGRVVGWILVSVGLAVIFAGETVDGLMIGLIGWFLGASARSVDRWLLLDGLIKGVRVGEAMEPTLETISPQLTLDTFAGQVLDGTLGPALPVVRDEVLVGLVGALQLRGVPQREWPSTRTVDVMIDVADLPPPLGPDESLSDGLERLRASRLDGLPVLDNSGLRGVLTRRSIAVALRARADLRGVTL